MAKKHDESKILDKYGPMLKKFGSEIGDAAKRGEESLVTMSKLLKIQFDMLGVTLQKEKLYHEIGKEVAEKIIKGTLKMDDLEKYKKPLAAIQAESENKKKAMSKVKSAGKKKPKEAKRKVKNKKKEKMT